MSEPHLTAALFSHAPYARWDIYREPLTPKSEVATLYQTGSMYYPPDRVAEFIIGAAATAVSDCKDLSAIRLLIPDAGTSKVWSPPLANRPPTDTFVPTDPLAAVMYRFWPEVMPAEFIRKRLRLGHPHKKIGFHWSIWYGEKPVEASFKSYTKAGTSIPVYDITRRPIMELVAAMSAPGGVAELLAAL